MSKNIIGICGKKRAGKGLAAAAIKAYDSDFVEVAFGDALKQECADSLGITVQEINDDKEFYRPFLQWYGSSFRRRQNERYWIEKLEQSGVFESAEKLVVSDVRFLNEIEWIKSLGGGVIHVTRDYPCDENSQHISEDTDGLGSECHLRIENDGSPEYIGTVVRAAKELSQYFRYNDAAKAFNRQYQSGDNQES